MIDIQRLMQASKIKFPTIEAICINQSLLATSMKEDMDLDKIIQETEEL